MAAAATAALIFAAVSRQSPGYGWVATRDAESMCVLPVFHLGRLKLREPSSEVMECVDKALAVFVETDSAAPNFISQMQTATMAYSEVVLLRPIAKPSDLISAAGALAVRFPEREPLALPVGSTDAQAVDLVVASYQALAGYQWLHSNEAQLLERTRSRGLKTIALETVHEQWAAISDATRHQSLTLLGETITKLNEGDIDASYEAPMQAWENGDASVLERIQQRLSAKYETERIGFASVVQGRNLSLARSIERNSRRLEQRSLVLVGALHFVGEQSLLHELRAIGYEVKPLK